jgi:hypothetical protein
MTEPLDSPAPEPPPPLPLVLAAELQDHLMTAANDLERLQRLLGDACEALMGHFYGANQHLCDVVAPGSALAQSAAQQQALQQAVQQLAGAVTALQFQDMASQLIHHTHCRLRNCADRLACDVMGDDEDGAAVITPAPERPNPVTQDEMDAGSVELF